MPLFHFGCDYQGKRPSRLGGALPETVSTPEEGVRQRDSIESFTKGAVVIGGAFLAGKTFLGSVDHYLYYTRTKEGRAEVARTKKALAQARSAKEYQEIWKQIKM